MLNCKVAGLQKLELKKTLIERLTIGLFVLSMSMSVHGQDSNFDKRLLAAIQLYKDGKTDDSARELESLIAVDPKNSDVEAWLGFIYERQNLPAKALPLLEQAAIQRPNDLEVANNLGNAYYSLGDFDKALERYIAIEKLSSRMFEPHYNSGTIYLKQKSYALAIDEFLKAKLLKPTDPFVLNNLGVAYENNKDYADAITSYSQADALAPTNLLFARNAGMLLARRERFGDAIPFLERVTQHSTEASVNLTLAESYAKVGKYTEALSKYESIRSTQTDNPTFWFNLGVLRNRAGDVPGAEQAYSRVLEISPSDLDALNNLGLLLFKDGKFSQSMVLFDKLSGLNPSSISARLNFAAAAVKAGESKRAMTVWKELLKEIPDRVDVRLDLANALWDSNEFDEAKNQYLAVLSVNRNNAEALNGVGLYYLHVSHFAQAEVTFRSSIEANPKFVPAYNNLAITLEHMNQKAQAISVLEKAQLIDPHDEDVMRNLRRLRTAG